MKLKLIALLIAGLLTGELIAQDRYVVFFTDKNNSPYSTANPLQFLSQRAIDRRNNQNITIDQTDFPVNQCRCNRIKYQSLVQCSNHLYNESCNINRYQPITLRTNQH